MQDAATTRPAIQQQRLPLAGRDGARTLNDPLWAEVDVENVQTLPPYAAEWSVEHRELVRISDAVLSAQDWTEGDAFVLPVPQLGQTYRAEIEAVNEGPGARAFLALTDGPEAARRCVVTVGPSSLFAYIDTPFGPYELLASHSYGWLVPSSSLGLPHAAHSTSSQLRRAKTVPATPRLALAREHD